MKNKAISNTDDILDSRDVIARIEELESFREDAKTDGEEKHARPCTCDANEDSIDSCERHKDNDLPEKQTAEDGTEYYTSLDFDEDAYKELTVLLALQEEASGSPDWKYGETLIRDTYFEEYAEQLADDIGAISKDQSWPNNCIDWEKASDMLKQDYFSVDFDGEEYWIRS